MLTKMEPIIKEWYDYLNEGKLMGMKCKECGDIEFPPLPVCNDCSSTEMEWTEISPDGELFAFNLNSTGVFPYTDEVTLAGYIKLDAGMTFIGQILDYGIDDQKKLYEKLKSGPVRARLVVKPLNDEFQYPFIEVL